MASSVFFFIFLTISTTHISLSSSEFLLLPLTHSLSTSHFNSTHHLLKSTSTRSAARFHHHRRTATTTAHNQVSLPLSPGTDYTLSFSLASQTISLYMDTGSDLVWFPCSPFQCILCDGKYNLSSISNPTPFNLSAAKTTAVTCKSPACSAAHSSLPSSDLCAIANCPLETIEISDCAAYKCPPLYYAYGDGSFIARLYRDKLSIPMSSPPLFLPNFTFGCAHSALGEPIGVAGFGRGLLSLPAQLSAHSPQLGNRFSYCLVSHSFDADRAHSPSPLILGRNSVCNKGKKVERIDNEIEFAYTPMLDNPKHPYFYCVGLEAVTVGGRRILAPKSMKRVDGRGNGGMVVDSGTTFTMLPTALYESIVTEFDRRVGRVHKRASRIEDNTGLSPCYYMGNSVSAVVPMVVLHFGGNSSVVLPRRNYFYEFLDGGDDGKGKRRVGCMMLMDGGDDAESGGPVGILGNYQQQGFEVVYDLEKREVGFARRQCASLWDSLNKR